MLNPKLSKKIIEVFPLNPVTGDFGVEIELEGDYLPVNGLPGWNVKVENSLRGKDGRSIGPDVNPTDPDIPREYVVKGAATYAQMITRMTTMNKAMNADTRTVQRLTSRTSTHIHLNMQDRTLRELFGYILIHTIVEPVLLRLCGAERNGNLFCLPAAETGDFATHIIPQWMASMTQYPPGVQFGKYWYKRGKYSCLNTDPLMTFGTVETRCFPASTDPATVLKWCRWILAIRNMAVEWPEDTYNRLLDRAYNHPQEIAGKIFEGENLQGATYPDNLDTLIRAGVEQAYELLRAMKPVFEYDEKKKTKTKKVIPEWTVVEADWDDPPMPPQFWDATPTPVED